MVLIASRNVGKMYFPIVLFEVWSTILENWCDDFKVFCFKMYTTDHFIPTSLLMRCLRHLSTLTPCHYNGPVQPRQRVTLRASHRNVISDVKDVHKDVNVACSWCKHNRTGSGCLPQGMGQAPQRMRHSHWRESKDGTNVFTPPPGHFLDARYFPLLMPPRNVNYIYYICLCIVCVAVCYT